MIRFFGIILSVLLIPFIIGISTAFYGSFSAIQYLNVNLHLFLWGIFFYMAMHLLVHEPNYTYTLGHEAIHVLATWLCGGKVTSFHVSSQGGSVTTTKDNFFINISPYLIPAYTILVSVVYIVIRRLDFMDIPKLGDIFIFLLGFTMAMHVIMTVRTLKIKQPDLVKSGMIFSVVLIYVINLLIVYSMLSFILDMASLPAFLKKAVENSKDIYLAIYNKLYNLTLT